MSKSFHIEVREFESEAEMLAYMNDPNSEFNQGIKAYEKAVREEASVGLTAEELYLYNKWMDRTYSEEELKRCNEDRGNLYSAIMHSISAGFG